MNEDDALDNRIDKIHRTIEKCRYGIHDISRTQLNKEKLPRFNMPFELGIFFGAKRFGQNRQKLKNALILDKERFRFQQYISDIAGVDIRSHNNDADQIVQKVRSWLGTASRRKLPGERHIGGHFAQFYIGLPKIVRALGINGVSNLTFNEYCKLVEEYIEANVPLN